MDRLKKLIILIVLAITPSLCFGAEIFSYGFEDWGGTIATTPLYPMGSTASEYCTTHEDGTEVVSAYNTVHTPHSGSYFLIVNTSEYAMNPLVSGIDTNTINTHTQWGVTNPICGDDTFTINTSLTEGGYIYTEV